MGVSVAGSLVDDGVTETTKEDFRAVDGVALTVGAGVADAGTDVLEAVAAAAGLASAAAKCESAIIALAFAT